MARRIRTYEPRSIDLGDNTSLTVGIKRLSVTEANLFDRLFWRAMLLESERLVLVRRPGDEQERQTTTAISAARLAELQREAAALADGDGPAVKAFLLAALDELRPTDRWVVPDEEIRRRRLLEMTDDQRARYEAIVEEDKRALAAFLSEALAQFVNVHPDQLEIEDAVTGEVTPVTNGEQLARCFGARQDLLQAIVHAIRDVNELSAVQKNGSGSRSTSSTSLPARDPKATGGSSEPTAAPADSSASVTTGAATPTVMNPSGATV